MTPPRGNFTQSSQCGQGYFGAFYRPADSFSATLGKIVNPHPTGVITSLVFSHLWGSGLGVDGMGTTQPNESEWEVMMKSAFATQLPFSWHC